MKYKVKIRFIYSDIVEVEAGTKKEAVSFALDDCQEEYEYFYDATVIVEEDE